MVQKILKFVVLPLVVLGLIYIVLISRSSDHTRVVVLGIAQDGGHPQLGCQLACCNEDLGDGHLISCIAVTDPRSGQRWIFDATPDLPRELRRLDKLAPVEIPTGDRNAGIAGIFLTHAHMGHYTGLMHFGREAAGARSIPVYAMPRMRAFLEGNGPWDQLVRLNNIELRDLVAGTAIDLSKDLSVTPLEVPHRDEYSETVGFVIRGRRHSALFIPDIDKWERWDRSLRKVLGNVDRAYVDGTFFSAAELPGRDFTEIPHPTIQETIHFLEDLPEEERAKVHFIHLNHTNPALDGKSEAARQINEAGMSVAREGESFRLD